MVHALLESRRVLGVGGVLVDIRPYVSRPDLEVITAGEIFVPGKLDDEGGAVDDVAADVAMAEVVRRGFFVLEGQDSFLFSLYWNSLEGMLAYAAEKWSFVEIATAVVERAGEYAAGVDGAYRVRVRNVVRLRRYRKV